MHPEVVALAEKVRLTEQFLDSSQQRISQRVAELRKSQLGPWLLQMVQQKLDESRKKEEILNARFEETRAEAINLSGQLAQIELLERDVKRLSDMNDVLLNQIASLGLEAERAGRARGGDRGADDGRPSRFPAAELRGRCSRSWAVSASPWAWSRCWMRWTTASVRSTRCRAGWVCRC